MNSKFLIKAFLLFIINYSLALSGIEGFINKAYAQEKNKKAPSFNITMISVSGGIQLPGADMASRFGISGTAKIDLNYKTANNWIFGLSSGPLFGNLVKDTVLNSISTQSGQIIAESGRFTLVDQQQRGFMAFATVGKIFPIIGPNQSSGLMCQLGLGLLQHKIWINDVENAAPQLRKEYLKGYDRLSNGFALNQFIAYQHFSNNKRVNFYFGIEMTQAFTKNRRSFNFDTMEKEDVLRSDLLFGIRLGWILPFYGRASKDFIYF